MVAQELLLLFQDHLSPTQVVVAEEQKHLVILMELVVLVVAEMLQILVDQQAQ
jgi:hypothetical protein